MILIRCYYLVSLIVYVSFYLHLSKYINSDHLCYIYLASFTSPARNICDSVYICNQCFRLGLRFIVVALNCFPIIQTSISFKWNWGNKDDVVSFLF